MSNSKLFPEQKAWVKEMLAEGNISVFCFPEQGMTVAVMRPFPTSNVVRVSTAVCSPDEKKFRPSMGKYVALCRMENGDSISLPFEEDCWMSLEQQFQSIAAEVASIT